MSKILSLENLKPDKENTVYIEKGTIITPSVLSVIKRNNIKIKYNEDNILTETKKIEPKLIKPDPNRIAAVVGKILGGSGSKEEIIKETQRVLNMIKSNPSISDKQLVLGHKMNVPKKIQPPKKEFKKVIISTFGLNKSGIVYGISKIIAENEGNILEISQTIVDKYFSLILIVDISNLKNSFDDLKKELLKTGDNLSLKIAIQHEDIFKAMHKV